MFNRTRTTAYSLSRCALLLVATVICILPRLSLATTSGGILLWNKLGSDTEVLNSAFGPNLGFYNTPGGLDAVANPAYVPGEFGNALSIGPGSYGSALREHNVVWSNVNQYLNPDRGTISAWFKQNSNPVDFDHGVYRIFDGDYGLGSGIGLSSHTPFPNSGPTQLYFGMDFGGAGSGVSANISAFNGTWIHVAGVWDRNGIANTNDKIRLYVNGTVAASTTVGGWGSTVGQFADIAGANDNNIVNQFAVDNLKVYDVALTDFSDRFNESSIPEPTCLCLIGTLGALLLRRRSPTL